MGDYEVILDDDLHLVRASARGPVTKSLGHQMITEVRGLAAQKGYAILWNVVDADIQVALGDWFFLPRELDALQQGPSRSTKVAVVVSPAALEAFRFYEVVAANVGLNLKVFLDEQAAIDWLT